MQAPSLRAERPDFATTAIAARRTPVWCIFANTGAGAANALTLIERFAAHKSGQKKAVKNRKRELRPPFLWARR
jgi:hypothetical protein